VAECPHLSFDLCSTAAERSREQPKGVEWREVSASVDVLQSGPHARRCWLVLGLRRDAESEQVSDECNLTGNVVLRSYLFHLVPIGIGISGRKPDGIYLTPRGSPMQSKPVFW